MPVMVCVEVYELSEDARVLNVVVGSQERDISLAHDSTRVVLVYDESAQCLAPSRSRPKRCRLLMSGPGRSSAIGSSVRTRCGISGSTPTMMTGEDPDADGYELVGDEEQPLLGARDL